MTFSKISEFKVVGEGPVSKPKSELEQLQIRWAMALEDGFQSKRLPVQQFKQDGRARLFYILKQGNKTKPLETIMNMRCIRDDLVVYDVQVTYTHNGVGIRQEATFRLVRDPRAEGVDPTETVKLVNKTIREFSPAEGGEQ
jgi:hypothetical protein